MEPETPDDRPESPKKKIRPSSTTNSEVSHSATGSVGTSDLHSEMNGAAPTRQGRLAEASSSSETTRCSPNGPGASPGCAPPPTRGATDTIQEEVVSSSEENTAHRVAPPSHYGEGDADSPTNEAEVLLSRAAAEQTSGSEAERKYL